MAAVVDFEALPNLLYLDVSLLSYQSASQAVRFAASELQELYIKGTQCAVFDLEMCTSLTSLGIRHSRGYTVQDLALPRSLERLCLHNVLTASIQPELHLLTNLEHLKVGAEPATNVQDINNFMERLPKLPSSLLKLDILESGITNLDQLTLLTRLKKLGIPSSSTSQQLSIIKCLRQLRHVYAIKGMNFLSVC